MAQHSIQDIETRLQQVERMLLFAMKAFAFQDTSNPFSRPRTLLDEYYRSLQVTPSFILTDDPEDDKVVDAEVAPVPPSNGEADVVKD